MKTETTIPYIGFAQLAKVALLEVSAIEKMVREGLDLTLGAFEERGAQALTPGETRVLAQAFAKRGYRMIAQALTVFANQIEATPSLALHTGGKTPAAGFAWQERADLQ